ncbi:MAG TPA: hypothetical protein VF982_10820 [Anaerolineales bacterium]
MMSSESGSPERAYQKYAWLIPFILAVLLSLGMAFMLVWGTDPGVFESDTGVAWSEFSSAYPTVATYLILDERLLAAGLLGFGAYTAVVTYLKYRKGERWAWYTLWFFPGMLALLAALFYLHDQGGTGTWYVGLATIAVLGMLLPVRKFFRKQ